MESIFRGIVNEHIEEMGLKVFKVFVYACCHHTHRKIFKVKTHWGKDMIRNRPVYQNTEHRIRNQDVLIGQIKNDYKQCKNLWERVEKEIIDISETERILQIIAWVKAGIEELKEIQGSQIEGISWGEMNNIEKEVLRIQDKIRIKIRCLFSM